MFRKAAKFLLGLILTLVLLALVAAGALGTWVMTGPKSLSKLTPYVERSLNNDDLPYKVNVRDVILAWEGWLSPLGFRLKGVSVLSRQDAPLLNLNELSVKLDIPSLLRFRIVPHSIVVHRPSVYIFRDGQGEFLIGFGDTRNTGIPLRDFFASVGGDEDGTVSGSLQRISIRHARLTMGSEADESLFRAPDANLEISREGDSIRLLFGMNVKAGEYVSNLQITGLVRPGNEMIVGQMRLTRFSPHLLASLFPNQPEWAALNMPLDGEAAISVDAAGNLSTLDFKLEGTEGIFTLPEHFAEPLPVRHMLLEGQFRNNLRQLLLNQASLDFGGTTLSLNGFAMHTPAGWTYDALAVAEKMPANDLYKYWPKTLAATPYAWVTAHIRDGIVPHAEARISVSEEDLAAGVLPKDALDVTIRAEGMTVEYLEGYPKARNVAGVVNFNAHGMEITSQKGEMLSGGALKTAYLSIPELAAEAPHMHISLEVEAPAADVASYLSIPELGFSGALGLDPKSISGQASAKMRFDFLLPDEDFPERDDELDFLIEAQLRDAAQPGFMQEGDLSAVNGALAITQKQLSYTGGMTMSGVPLTVELSHLFEGAGEYPTTYKASGVMTTGQLTAFGVPEFPFLSGDLSLSAEIRRSPTASNTRATVDATQVAALVPEIGLQKLVGQQARLQLEVDRKADSLQIRSFDLQGKNLAVSGSVALHSDLRTIGMLTLSRVAYGRNDFSLTMKRLENGYNIEINGPSLDLAPLMAKNVSETAEKQNKEFPFAFNLQGRFGSVFLGGQGGLRGVDARFNCHIDHCPSADVNGHVGEAGDQDTSFQYRIAYEEGQRRLELTAQDAGGFLRDMELFDGMQGGRLIISGDFDDNDPQRPMKGRLIITEHNITNAPTLAKMASLLSLTGIANTIAGKGISFNKVASDLTVTDSYILLKNGKMIGPALGITVENGLINRLNDQVTFNGTVVPSYTLNSALGNIPLIGQVLSGGEGQGVFAATYKVEGTYPDKIEVSVNPLAMLAPGFLRNLFGSSVEPELPKEEERLPGETGEEVEGDTPADAVTPAEAAVPEANAPETNVPEANRSEANTLAPNTPGTVVLPTDDSSSPS